jgi:hypothetical protein
MPAESKIAIQFQVKKGDPVGTIDPTITTSKSTFWDKNKAKCRLMTYGSKGRVYFAGCSTAPRPIGPPELHDEHLRFSLIPHSCIFTTFCCSLKMKFADFFAGVFRDVNGICQEPPTFCFASKLFDQKIHQETVPQNAHLFGSHFIVTVDAQVEGQ